MLDALRKDDLDLGFISAVNLSGLTPEFRVFDLPFLFRDAVHACAVLDGPVGQDYLNIFRRRDLVALAWGENGMRHVTPSKRPVREPADPRGLRLRVPQSDVTPGCFRQLGAEAVALGYRALSGALESGSLDGQENPVSSIRAICLERLQRRLTLIGHVYSSATVFMSTDCWDDLAPAECEAFAAAARAGGLVSRQAAGRAEHEGLEALRAAGMQVVPAVDRRSFLAALEPA